MAFKKLKFSSLTCSHGSWSWINIGTLQIIMNFSYYKLFCDGYTGRWETGKHPLYTCVLVSLSTYITGLFTISEFLARPIERLTASFQFKIHQRLCPLENVAVVTEFECRGRQCIYDVARPKPGCAATLKDRIRRGIFGQIEPGLCHIQADKILERN